MAILLQGCTTLYQIVAYVRGVNTLSFTECTQFCNILSIDKLTIIKKENVDYLISVYKTQSSCCWLYYDSCQLLIEHATPILINVSINSNY